MVMLHLLSSIDSGSEENTWTKDEAEKCIYYCSMCLFRSFYFFPTRTRYIFIFQQNLIYGKGQNLYVLATMYASVCIQLLFPEIHYFNDKLDTGWLRVKYILSAFVFGIFSLIIDELRKLIVESIPKVVLLIFHDDLETFVFFVKYCWNACSSDDKDEEIIYIYCSFVLKMPCLNCWYYMILFIVEARASQRLICVFLVHVEF